MKKSDVEKELAKLKEDMFFMRCNNSGRDDYRSEVRTKIELYEKLLKEGYAPDK